jgi:hypothetical protein
MRPLVVRRRPGRVGEHKDLRDPIPGQPGKRNRRDDSPRDVPPIGVPKKRAERSGGSLKPSGCGLTTFRVNARLRAGDLGGASEGQYWSDDMGFNSKVLCFTPERVLDARDVVWQLPERQ